MVYFANRQNQQVRKMMKVFFIYKRIRDILSLPSEGNLCIGMNFEFMQLQPGSWWDVSEIPVCCAHPVQEEQNEALR